MTNSNKDPDTQNGQGSDQAPGTLPQEQPSGGLPQFVTKLTSMEQQVGTHVIEALRHPDTVAVMSAVAAGADGHQRIISIGLDAKVFEQIRQLLTEAKEEQKQRVPCFGFNCRFQDEESESDEKADA